MSTLLAFTSIGVLELRQKFLDFHEYTLGSSVATIRRYRAATQHLEAYPIRQTRPPLAHELKPDAFSAYLHKVGVASNGHPNIERRQLRDKGVQFIQETCQSMYTFALKRRHLPPYAENPFSELPLDRLKLQDAKPIFVFTAATELVFLRAADRWAFPVHFTLGKTGLRVGELVHLLIEELDMEGGWLLFRNKTELSWRVKTENEQDVAPPLGHGG